MITTRKNRLFAGALAAAMALCCAPHAGAQPFLEDVNLDGEVDLQDMNRIINVVLGFQPATPYEPSDPRPVGAEYTVNGVSFRMVRVEGGTFTMGATEEQGDEAEEKEKPVHEVTLSDFAIGQTEVTQELWLAVMGSNPSNFAAAEGDTKALQKPVENVSWWDCQTFIAKLNELTGMKFRLPFEAEWEYAARGGSLSEGHKYSGASGDDIYYVAWHAGNILYAGPQLVATKRPNELGLYDMSGNVYEWCEDWHGVYPSEAVTNPPGPSEGTDRATRGGGWQHGVSPCRVSSRGNSKPTFTASDLGLRLAL